MIFLIGLVLWTCCSTQIGTEVEKHKELSFQYADEGKKMEAEAEREQTIKLFETSLEAQSADATEFINASCVALIQSEIEILKRENVNIGTFREAVLTGLGTATQAGAKICPLAEQERKDEITHKFIFVTIVHRHCGDIKSLEQKKQWLATSIELKGLAAFYCVNGILNVMPERSPPSLPAPEHLQTVPFLPTPGGSQPGR